MKHFSKFVFVITLSHRRGYSQWQKMQIESKIILSSRLTVEGPLRLKEEYIEGMLESPTVIEEAVPEQLKGALGQAATTLQQLPALIKDTLASGLRIPLSKLLYSLFCPKKPFSAYTCTEPTSVICFRWIV